MSVLPKPIRSLYYWMNEQGTLGKWVVNAGSYAYMAGVKLAGVKPWKDLSALTIISHKYKFIYIGIPKIATRSFQDIFINDKDREKEFEIEWAEKPFAFQEYCEKYPDYFTFGFVRNPFSRIASCYSSKIEGCEPGKQARIMSFYKNLYPDMSFHDFCIWLNSDEGKDDISDRHWISQHLFFENKNKKIDYIGRYENLESDWEDICKRIGIEHIPLEQKGWVTKEKFKKDYKSYYDDSDIKHIIQRYKTDFETFDYEKTL